MYVDVSLGTLEEARQSPCEAHKSLVLSLQQRLDNTLGAIAIGPQDPPFGHWRVSDQLELSRVKSTPGRMSRLVVHRESTQQSQQFDLVLVERQDISNHQGVAILLDPDWIDLDRCRSWLSQCRNSHGSGCVNPMEVIHRPPGLLIDIKRQCIVVGKPEHQYFALSYRIGEAGAFLLRPENLDALREENALRAPEIRSSLQLTVQHAMSLAEALGAAYLWVDVLCVIHDSKATSVAEQLNDMASIYSSALMTIVVADGDGSNGIPGLRGISQSRNLQQDVFPFRDEQFLLRPGDLLARGGRYHGRAWTHQEYKMSPRKLVFRFNEAHWECSGCTCFEYLARPKPGSPIFALPRHILLDGVPDLQDLFVVVISEYNRKALTYPEDALSAVMGLLAVFSRTFTGGFLYGLPEILFDAALGWDPSFLTRRRKKSERSGHVELGPSALPSWSWIGWEGSFKMRSTEPCKIASKENPRPTRRETSPITEWFTSHTPNDQSPRKIVARWLQNRDRFEDVGQPLLEGWSRHDTGEAKGSPHVVYQHTALRRYGKPQFWKYPFSLPKIDSSMPLTHPEQTQYLLCKTWKTVVWIRRSTDLKQDFGRTWVSNEMVICRDLGGPMIGTMYVSEFESWAEREAQCIDVVAISKFVEFGKRPEHKMIKVLWVTWKDGIAYRCASGEVDEEAWCIMEYERKLEKIDLVLG